jgi:hypothetical protein
MKNYVASITTQLRNHAKAHQLDFAPLVEQFALGRLLARLSQSPYHPFHHQSLIETNSLRSTSDTLQIIKNHSHLVIP